MRRVILLGEAETDWPPALGLLGQLREGRGAAVGIWVVTGWTAAWWADDGSGWAWPLIREHVVQTAEAVVRSGRRLARDRGYEAASDRIWIGNGREALAAALLEERAALLVAAAPQSRRMSRLLSALILGGPVPVAVATRRSPLVPFKGRRETVLPAGLPGEGRGDS